MFLLDTHMHFDLMDVERYALLEQLERENIYTIAVTNLPELYIKYKNQINWDKYKYCRLALGFHPELVVQHCNQIDNFIKMLPNSRYIGEVGLDFSNNDLLQKKIQIEIFQQIINECGKYKNKILSVHSRKAVKETLETMKFFEGKAIFHWYSGSIKDLEEIIERGYFLSINHQMLKSENGRKIINLIPTEKLLIESDAPFTYGFDKKYSVFFVEKIYNYLSDTRHINIELLSKTIKSNFRNLLIN